MNISNASCEYFYDEEYDVAINEGTYNQPFLSSFNNNYYPFTNSKDNNINQFKRDYLTTSRLWSECQLDNSENNNYDELNGNLDTSIFKCKSSDNVIDVSQYSSSNGYPYLNQIGENSFNYRIYFERRDLIDGKGNFDIRKQFAKRYNSKVFIDSGKCSAATSDSLIQPFKHYRNALANSENNLNETSQENFKESNNLSHRKKSSKELWRKLKSVFSLKKIRWKKIISDSTSTRFSRSYSVPCLTTSFAPSNDECFRSNRFSTTVVELYNLFTDLSEEWDDSVILEKEKHSQYVQTPPIQTNDAGCQIPELFTGIRRNRTRTRRNVNIEYPGLGKIQLPHQLRTPNRHLIDSDSGFANLKFLENISETRPNFINRSSSATRMRGRMTKCENDDSMDCRKKPQVLARCASESRYKHCDPNRTHREIETYPASVNNASELVIIEENKSVSFSDLRPIPRKWGLSNGDQILAIFEFPSRTSMEVKTVDYDEESSIRIGALVANAIGTIKSVSTTINNSQDLVAICDKFIRCKDSKRYSTPALLLAVDAIVTLISDGLSIDSVRGKKMSSDAIIGSKITIRMWMFIEESCRSSLIKDVSQKLAFANLLKQVKQICGNVGSKESLAQVKLQIFIVIAIKSTILHIWLKSVVANDTILHRFFASCSFLQQARTSYSNALSAVVVELRRLSTVGDSKHSNITKPVKGKARQNTARQISNSSSDNSISKSRIPRPSKKLSNGSTK